jgi:hypothetical protein
MLFSLGANGAVALIIEHAPRARPLCPNIAASPENNRVRVKRRSQVRCKYLM